MARGSASKVARWRRCKHACWYSDVLNLKPIVTSIAPQKGTILHECLRNHYTNKDWTDPIKNLKIDLDKVFDEEREEWANLPSDLYRIMKGYINAYRTIDTGSVVLATEYKVEYKLNERHTYLGYIDMIIMGSDKRVWIVDHKTVKVLPEERDLYMDLQLLMYYDAVMNDKEMMKKIKSLGGTLAGVMFNHIKTKAPREPAVLKSGGLSKAAIDTDVATYFETVRKYGLDPQDYEDMIEKLQKNTYYKRMKLPVNMKTLEIIKSEVIATLNDYEDSLKAVEDGKMNKLDFVRNTLKQRCSWDCSYQKLCYGELAGMNIQNILESEYEERVSDRESEDANGNDE